MDVLTADLPTPVNLESLSTNREFHNDKNSTYWLPKDKEEHDRLTGQHFALKELFGGNVLPSVKKALDFEGGISVLDVGCGSGAWLADMSSEYPNCTYNGCDIIESPEIIKRLPNLKFTYGNAVQGLPYEDNTFDFVQMRLLVWALRADEWPIVIKEIIRVAKPGGMIQFVETTPELPEDKNSICYRTAEAMINFSIERGQIPNIVYKLEDLVSANSNVKIVQSYKLPFNTNNGTPLAKTAIWNISLVVEGMMIQAAPKMGLDSEEEISEYMAKFKEDLLITGFRNATVSLSLQKLST
ncbi:S-adenosyl-L-methionine-dependent methyltransferase [Sporodiniella umbellata]|nr:S-adenosyl-L-methionine-dependent methyltransferase [Sporodiniella umbellata]